MIGELGRWSSVGVWLRRWSSVGVWLRRWSAPSGAPRPFQVRELGRADDRIEAIFQKSFRAPAPTIPRHFVALLARHPELVAGYVHHTVYQPGVFLLGGLCVDPAFYRILTPAERTQVAVDGSLARLLLKESIEQLGATRAVFAFTGDTRSRRDVLALGFVPATGPYLVVQWHGQPEAARTDLVAEVAALGPF